MSAFTRRPLWLQLTAVVVVAAVAFAGVVVFLGPASWRADGWVPSPGVVADVREQGDATIVVYRFDSDFGRIGGEVTLPAQSPEALARDGIAKDARIEVLVDPDDERRSVPAFALARERATFLGAAIMVGAAFVAAVVTIVVAHRRRVRRPGRHDPTPAADAAVAGERSARGDVRGAPPVDGGHLSVDGTVLSVGALGRGDRIDADADGIVVRPHDDAPVRLAWDDVRAFSATSRDATHAIRVDAEAGSWVCELHQPRDRPLVTDEDLDAAVGILQFCRAYRTARERLTSPVTLRRVIAETTSAARRTHLPPSLAAARPDLPAEALDALATVADRIVEASGVQFCGGRTVRGYRVVADDDTLSAAREWLPPKLSRVDDVSLRAALDTAQGPLPPWPFDLLLG